MREACLLNDTSATANPGCVGTVSGLLSLLRKHGICITSTAPVGTGTKIFQSAIRKSWWRTRSGMSSRRLDFAAPRIIPAKWEQCRSDLLKTWRPPWKDAEVVIVNGEGTLHHNQASALSLLALAQSAMDDGKAVWIVNATLEALDPWLIENVIARADYVAVREPDSFAYLKQLGLSNIAQAADCLWTHTLPRVQCATPMPPRSCLYTPGVTVKKHGGRRLPEKEVMGHLGLLRDAGWEPTYLVVEREDIAMAESVQRRGIPSRSVRGLRLSMACETLAPFDLCVSGRFHIAILGWLMGKAIIPLSSNTWKLSGLLKQIGVSSQPADSMSEFEQWLAREPVRMTVTEVAHLQSLAEANVPDQLEQL